MPLSFTKYIKIKDKYCCLYLGESPEYVVALNLLKTQIEEQLPGLQLIIGCQNKFRYLLEDSVDSEKINKSEYAYVREIRNDVTRHSILKLMEESQLKIKPVNKTSSVEKGICIICPEGAYPVKSMSKEQINKMSDLAKATGYSPVVLGSDIHHSLEINIRPKEGDKIKYIKEAKWVIGVENEYTLLGAVQGTRTTVFKTGIGYELFKQLCPKIETV